MKIIEVPYGITPHGQTRQIVADSNDNVYAVNFMSYPPDLFPTIFRRQPSDEYFKEFVRISYLESWEYVYSIDLTIDSSDRVWALVVAAPDDVTKQSILLTAFNPDGSIYYALTEIASAASGHHKEAVFEIDNAGKIWVVWTQSDSLSDVNLETHFLRRNANGTADIADTTISTGVASWSAPMIAFDANNRCFITWLMYNSGVPKAIIYNPDGSIYKAAFDLNTGTGTSISRNQMITDSNGRVMIIGKCKQSGESYFYPKYSVYGLDGTLHTGWTTIGDPLESTYSTLAATKDTDGNLYLVLTYQLPGAYSPAYAYYDVYITKLDTAMNPVFENQKIFTGSAITWLVSNYMKNNLNGNCMEFIFTYRGYEVSSTVNLEIDTFVPTEAIFAKIGLLY